MDSAMRDLDQLREEQRGETRGPRLGLFALATALSVVAVFSISLLRGQDAADAKESLDPLEELALSSAGQRHADQAPAAAPEVRPETLSFPATLTESDDPLIEATVHAAAAEHAALLAEPPGIQRRGAAELPAAHVATQDHARLSRVAKHDPLMALALPQKPAAALAPRGAEGAYTLQVVSYESRREAYAFAETLRARGHKAFVAEADVPGRGRYFRVRVGPFDQRRDAESYQARFEDSEQMHTILVSNR